MIHKLRPLNVVVFLIVVLLVFPALFLIPLSLTSAATYRFPPPGWSFRWYENLFTDSGWLSAMLITLKAATASAALAVVIGTCATFALFKFSAKVRTVGTTTLISPLVIPNILIALAMYATFLKLELNGTLTGLVLGYTCLAVPYVIIAVSARLQGYKQSLTSAALSLGATPFAAFRSVTFPLMLPGIAAGGVFAFVIGTEELVISLLLQGPDTTTLSVKMYNSAVDSTDPTLSAASTVLVIGVSAVLFIVQVGWANRRRRRLAEGVGAP